MRLTKRNVEALVPQAKPTLVRDAQLAGFGIRVMPSGKRFYLLRYRTRPDQGGRQRWIGLGEHGRVTVEQARAQALRVLHEVAEGRDPAGERAAFRAAPTVNDLFDRYLSEHVDRKNTTRAKVRAIVDRDLRPALGHLKVAAVTRLDIDQMHRANFVRPIQANRILAACRKAFELAELWGMRPDGTNPCRKIDLYPEKHRERYLSANELSRLGMAIRKAEIEGLETKTGAGGEQRRHRPFGRVVTAAIKLLLFTGCRLGEILNLRWTDIDFDSETILLSKTKAGRPQRVMMNAPARRVLGQLEPLSHSEWVLPSTTNPRKPFSKASLEAKWQQICEAAELNDVRLHDLRHTVGTYAAQTGGNAFLVRDLLRHKNVTMTQRYVNFADAPVRALSDKVGERIAAGLAGEVAAKVPLFKTGT